MPRPIPDKKQRRALQKIQSSNAEYIIGVDEVGYGALAGPVTVCAAIFLKDWRHSAVRDSKKLSHNRRVTLLADIIKPNVVYFVIKELSAEEIDRKQSVYKALWQLTIAAIQAAVAKFPDSIVVTDGNNAPKVKATVVCLPKADDLVPAVSAASIIAKVHRDGFMCLMHDKYPAYDFEHNKGYKAPRHDAGLRRRGPCDIHRLTFRPVKRAARDLSKRLESTNGP